MRIFFSILFVFSIQFVYGQTDNYFEYEFITDNGPEKKTLLTEKGVETLLLPVELNNLGELASELLTLRSITSDLIEKDKEKTLIIDANISKLDELEKRISQLESNTQPVSELDELKEYALQNNALSTIKRKYNEQELLDCCIYLKLKPEGTVKEQTTTTELAKLLIQYFKN